MRPCPQPRRSSELAQARVESWLPRSLAEARRVGVGLALAGEHRPGNLLGVPQRPGQERVEAPSPGTPGLCHTVSWTPSHFTMALTVPRVRQPFFLVAAHVPGKRQVCGRCGAHALQRKSGPTHACPTPCPAQGPAARLDVQFERGSQILVLHRSPKGTQNGLKASRRGLKT